MSRVSELVGVIRDPTPKLNRIVGDESSGQPLEKFYTVDIILRDCTIPLVISEYSLGDVCVGTVRVTCSLFSDFQQNQLPMFYLYCNRIEPVEPDTPMTNVVNFSGTVTKVKPLTVDAAGRDVLPMILSDTSPMQSDSVLYLNLKNQMARVNQNRKPRFKVQGCGFIKPYKDIYEIHVQEIEFF